MRRLLLSFALLACFAAPAHAAQGIGLRWDACLGDGGSSNKTFACNTNTGSDFLYVSFVSDQPITDVTGVEVAVHVNSVAATMPSWWSVFGSLSCRPTALSLGFTEGAQSATCQNAFVGNSAGGVAAYTNPFAGVTNYKQVLFVIAVAPSFAVTPGVEYFAGRLGISHVKTVSASSCAGCSEPVCIGLHTINLTHSTPTPNTHLTDETFPGSSYVSWQGGVTTGYVQPVSTHNPYPYRTISCALPVPARNGTWGSIKSLYR